VLAFSAHFWDFEAQCANMAIKKEITQPSYKFLCNTLPRILLVMAMASSRTNARICNLIKGLIFLTCRDKEIIRDYESRQQILTTRTT
jgi:hypothetical protein